MVDIEKVIKALEFCTTSEDCRPCEYWQTFNNTGCQAMKDALELLKEQRFRIKSYEYVFDFLGIGFKEWATKILEGKAEAICETDEHKREAVIRFKYI